MLNTSYRWKMIDEIHPRHKHHHRHDRNETATLSQVVFHRGDNLYLCAPVYFEAMRGLLWKQVPAKIRLLKRLREQFGWLQVLDEDWEQAAQLWANTVRQGKQLSDADLLIAAIAIRNEAVIVSEDEDFDALPIRRQNWRKL